VSKRVLCFYPLEADVRDRLRSLSPALEIVYMEPDAQTSVDALRDGAADALLANYCPADLGRVPSLRWLATVGAGVEHLRALDPWSRGITVTNGSGLHAVSIAEYVMAGMLTFSQKSAERRQNHAAHGWPGAWTEEWKGLIGTSLRGRTLTIVGYGSIGRAVAGAARGLGMRVIAIKARPSLRQDLGYAAPGVGDPDGVIPERMVGTAEIATCFAQSDYVVLAMPLTKSTDRIIDRTALMALPKHAVLINVGRGKVLDEDALIDRLRRGGIRGAVLDVASIEPVPTDSTWWDVPNLVLTPHVSAINDPVGWWNLVAGLMVENLSRYAGSRELVNVVDGAAGY
jgi:phosphoglycerate dehydrogenase-like enzyme